MDDIYYCPSDNESFYSDITVEAMHSKQPVATLGARWGRLLQTKEWSDCKFVITNSCKQECSEPKEFECHRLVLASCSPVFGAMLLGGMAETSKIIIQDETPNTFSHLLEFAYTGKMKKCNFSEAVQLYIAADKYQIDDLVDMCEDAMCGELGPENLCEAFQMSEQYSLGKLKNCSIRMLQDRTQDVISSTTFKEFSLDILLLLLCQDQLNIKSEQQLADAVMKWSIVHLQEIEQSRSETIEINDGTHNIVCEVCEKEDTAKKNQVSSHQEADQSLEKSEANQDSSQQCNTARNQKLRKLLRLAFKHIRFLVPSFKFDSFVEDYPGILTEEEIDGIKSFRNNYYDTKDDDESDEILKKIFCEDLLSPTLHYELKERNLPITSKYKNKCGKSVKLEHGALKMCDRVYNKDIAYEMNGESGDYFDCAFYLIPDHDITLHGIRVTSQVDLSGKYPPNATYEENIIVEVTKLGNRTRTKSKGEKILYDANHGGRILFNETVPYNSIINIMFPVPFRMFNAYSFEIKVEFNVSGTYPVVQTGENTPQIDNITMHFQQMDSIGKMCFVKGVIFESRDQNPPRMSKWELIQLYEIPSDSENSLDLFCGVDDDSDLDDDEDW